MAADDPGRPAAFAWSFSDGENATGPQATHTFSHGGMAFVMLTTRSLGGAQIHLDSSTQNILVVEQNGPYTLHAPMVGTTDRWHTETRLWNVGTAEAHVAIIDVVGTGQPALTQFTIPVNGVLDLPDWAFFCPTYYPCNTTLGPLLATVEFTSDQPFRLYTEVTLDTSYSGGRPGPPPAPPYWGGGLWDALSGTLLHGVATYFSQGTPVGIAWLTASPSEYRDNLYFVNPGALALTVTATFTDVSGALTVRKTYFVPSHSNAFFADLFSDPALSSFVGPVTVRLIGDQPFDAAASIISVESLCDVNGHFAFIQGEPLN